MYKEIKIDQIKSNPNNPRTVFEGKKFDDLVNSIKEKGVLEPILVRPVDGKFEIVAGERRYRAMLQISGEKQPEPGDIFELSGMIPAIIRELNDDEAFEIMIIENLQREDLTPLEEILSFEKYVKQHGREGIEVLAEKTGIQPTYIRRRIAALKLPKRALDGWSKGLLSFGHLEELIRIKDKRDMKEILDRLLGGYSDMSVMDLRNFINSRIPLLSKAKFDKAECSNCAQNSDVQKKLWDVELMKKTHCLNPKCFMKKQVDYFTKNWPEISFAKRYKTTGFAFDHDLGWDDKLRFYDAGPFNKCLEGCEKFKTIIKLDGTVEEGQACVKDEECFKSLKRAEEREGIKKGEKKKDDGGPRVYWHGKHFREEFLKISIPAKFEDYDSSDIKIVRLALFSILRSNRELIEWFARKMELIKEDGDTWDLKEGDIINSILGMELSEVMGLTKVATLQIVLQQDTVCHSDRMRAAEHIGINLAKEWEPTDDFYEKKTIKELLEYGEKVGILQHKKAKKFLEETLKKKKYSACRKTELIRVFKESGIDLVGKIPDEILGEKKK